MSYAYSNYNAFKNDMNSFKDKITETPWGASSELRDLTSQTGLRKSFLKTFNLPEGTHIVDAIKGKNSTAATEKAIDDVLNFDEIVRKYNSALSALSNSPKTTYVKTQGIKETKTAAEEDYVAFCKNEHAKILAEAKAPTNDPQKAKAFKEFLSAWDEVSALVDRLLNLPPNQQEPALKAAFAKHENLLTGFQTTLNKNYYAEGEEGMAKRRNSVRGYLVEAMIESILLHGEFLHYVDTLTGKTAVSQVTNILLSDKKINTGGLRQQVKTEVVASADGKVRLPAYKVDTGGTQLVDKEITVQYLLESAGSSDVTTTSFGFSIKSVIPKDKNTPQSDLKMQVLSGPFGKYMSPITNYISADKDGKAQFSSEMGSIKFGLAFYRLLSCLDLSSVPEVTQFLISKNINYALFGIDEDSVGDYIINERMYSADHVKRQYINGEIKTTMTRQGWKKMPISGEPQGVEGAIKKWATIPTIEKYNLSKHLIHISLPF